LLLPSQIKQPKEKKVNYGLIKNDMVINFIKDSNIYAIKILYFLTKLDQNIIYNITDKGLIKFHLDVNELCDYCNITTRSLHSNTKKMVGTVVTIIDEKAKTTEYVALISRAKFVNDKTLEIEIHDDIFNSLNTKINGYTSINLEKLMSLKSPHSIRMFALLTYINGFNNNRLKQASWTLKEFNNFFGTKLKSYPELERTILNKINKELSEIMPFSIEKNVEIKKTPGRKPIKSLTIKPISIIDASAINKVDLKAIMDKEKSINSN